MLEQFSSRISSSVWRCPVSQWQ